MRRRERQRERKKNKERKKALQTHRNSDNNTTDIVGKISIRQI
jgi:hypothetical protein